MANQIFLDAAACSTMTMRNMPSRPSRKWSSPRWSRTAIVLALLCILSLSGHARGVEDKAQSVVLDDRITKEATDYAHDLLKRLGLTDTKKLITGVESGDVDSLYFVAKHMVDNSSDNKDGPPAAAFYILHALADADGSSSKSRPPHVKSQAVLGTAYYAVGDKQKAIHYFQLAGEEGPHQAALYNAGRTYAEQGNWVPAIAYIRGAAVLGETHPEFVDEKLTQTVTKAYFTFSEKIANADLSIEQAADIFLYGALEDKLSEDDEENWKVAVTNLALFHDTTDGTDPDYRALITSFRHLRLLWENKASNKNMSPLQVHLLLKLTNDALGYLATLDDDFCSAAAGYAEALALSTYCHDQAATTTLLQEDKKTGDCFNLAVSRAVSYYRCAQDLPGVIRVRKLAGKHETAATKWKKNNKLGPLDQSPAVYYPKLRAKPFWETTDFATVHDLEQTYKVSKTTRQELEAVQALSEQSAREEIETSARGETIKRLKVDTWNEHVGFRNKISPYMRARASTDPASGEDRLGGWAEFGPLFDGMAWDDIKCRLAPTLCQALQSNPVSLCSKDQVSSKATFYGSEDAIVTMIRLQPGTRILPGSGPTNARLVMHLNLEGCQGVELTVGGAVAKDYSNDGHAVVFDDSFEHSIYHGGTKDCYLVKAVLAHPDLR